MAKWGSADFKELKKFRDKLADTGDIKALCEETTNEIAQFFLSRVIRLTPVDTGNLRRNWLVCKQTNNGKAYFVVIKNDTVYASYVEDGHRQEVGRYVPAIGKRLKAPWVEGRFMMKDAISQTEQKIPALTQRKIEKFFKEKTNGK